MGNLIQPTSLISISNRLLLSFPRDFLPRGSGIVTRRPLVLQLISANTGTARCTVLNAIVIPATCTFSAAHVLLYGMHMFTLRCRFTHAAHLIHHHPTAQTQ